MTLEAAAALAATAALGTLGATPFVVRHIARKRRRDYHFRRFYRGECPTPCDLPDCPRSSQGLFVAPHRSPAKAERSGLTR